MNVVGQLPRDKVAVFLPYQFSPGLFPFEDSATTRRGTATGTGVHMPHWGSQKPCQVVIWHGRIGRRRQGYGMRGHQQDVCHVTFPRD